MIRLVIRWLLSMPSPSQLGMGPRYYDAATRRYVRRRLAGQIPAAYLDADVWLWLNDSSESGSAPR